MKILLCNLFKSYTASSIQKYLKKMGYNCVDKTYYTPKDLYGDERIVKMVAKDIKLIRPDVVMSVNFWPPVARACNKAHIKYISYGYDSPQNIPELTDMDYETNWIFTFDREEMQHYRTAGIDRVFHAPLATDLEYWERTNPGPNPCDISLVGQIYESTLPGLLSLLDEYHKGFIKGVVNAQQRVYGYYMVGDLLSGVMVALNKCFSERGMTNPVSLEQMSYSVGSYITYLDRISILKLASKVGETHLYTREISDTNRSVLDGVNIFGPVEYESGMPAVFKASTINLNPILRVIQSGIPQRALDVMGCNAFLLSSYQPELAEYFIPGEEVVMYDSYEDAVDKMAFYLDNDDLRERIALRGYEKTKKFFGFENRLKEMLATAGI